MRFLLYVIISVSIIAVLSLFTTLRAQIQVMNNDLQIGEYDVDIPLGIGKRISFGGVYHNSDILSIYRYNPSFNSSQLRIEIGDDHGTAGDSFAVGAVDWNTGTYHTYLQVFSNGNIGVGTENPDEKLAVNGNIRAKEIKVEATNWPDYVFKKDYELMSLKEVEQHIQQHGHLPDIPKAEQIEAEGLSVGEMNKLLMKKVEELTLHLIEKDKEIQDLKSFQKGIVELEKRLHKLEKK